MIIDVAKAGGGIAFALVKGVVSPFSSESWAKAWATAQLAEEVVVWSMPRSPGRVITRAEVTIVEGMSPCTSSSETASFGRRLASRLMGTMSRSA